MNYRKNLITDFVTSNKWKCCNVCLFVPEINKWINVFNLVSLPNVCGPKNSYSDLRNISTVKYLAIKYTLFSK